MGGPFPIVLRVKKVFKTASADIDERKIFLTDLSKQPIIT